MNKTGDNFDERTALTIIWIILLVVFLVFPCCSTPRRRKKWRKRVKERRWHVYVAEEGPEDWFIAALERYRAAQQREEEAHRQGGNGPGNNSLTQVAADIVWREKEEPELRRALTEDLLSGYTKELQKADFIGIFSSPPHDDAEGEPTNDDRNIPTSNDDVDVERGVPIGPRVVDERDVPQNEEEIDIFGSDSMMENTYKVRLPAPGESSQPTAGEGGEGEDGDDTSREVPNGCAVCMDPFRVGDRVCWSSNNGCPHVFHEKCLVNWLLVLGRRRRMRMVRTVSSDDIDLTAYDMLCPCCRQDFVKTDGGSGNNEEGHLRQDI